MDTERSLLFGVVALQSGAVDAEALAETCAAWASEPTLPLAEAMVDRGLMTVEQRDELEQTVARELASHGGDPRATLAATIDGRSREALGGTAAAAGVAMTGPTELQSMAAPGPEAVERGHEVIGPLSPPRGEADARERYTRTHLHAKGGMGRVWLARDGALGREIALKDLRPEQADNTIVCSRFLYEAKITAQLEHPGIVPVYELGEGDAPYYTMRFVRGRTLTEAIRAYHKKRAAGEADSVGLNDLLMQFVGVCHAVAFAHSRGIIHRDLKGQNVVLGDFGEVMVLDWGLAKRVGPDPASGPAGAVDAAPADRPGPAVAAADATDADDGPARLGELDGFTVAATPNSGGISGSGSGPRPGSGVRGIPDSGAGPEGTMLGQLLGTPAYMAPEQALGRHDLVDRRTDIYGLGAILYEILAGRPPFAAPRSAEIVRMVKHEEPTPPRQVVPEVAPGLEAICLKALRKEMARRYRTASELAQEVRRHLADEPVEAYSEPWTVRARRWARRNRTKVAAAAGLLAAATVALAVSTVLVARERNEAEAQGRRARRAVHLLARGADIAFDDQLDPVQEEMLRDALEYYDEFTARSSSDPAVRLEHGRAYQQMGDIQRKLGRLRESEGAYLKAIGRLEPLGESPAVGREARRALARTRTLLADLLIRRGVDKGRAAGLYEQALEAQLALAGAGRGPAASAEDLLRLGQTLKSRGDLLRLDGEFREAGTTYDRAIAELERARAADVTQAEAPAALALAIDARGWIRRERGDGAGAEADFRRAVEQLEKLVASFPTAPRYREALARALNSLALVEKATGRLGDAEAHLRRELPLAERLSQDFPERAEYRRVLGRALDNLGVVVSDQGRGADAEPILRRAVDVAAALSVVSPDDVQIRLDLARDRVVLGEILREKGETPAAVAELEAARVLAGALIKQFPDRPRYRHLLAQDLLNLALARQEEPAKAEGLYRAAEGLFDELVAAYPENVDYRVEQATCLQNQGRALASAGQVDRAAAAYRRAVAQLDASRGAASSPQGMQVKAGVLNNLGDTLQATAPAEAEAALRRALGLLETLAARPSATLTDRHYLAAAELNLGDALRRRRALPEADAMLARAEADYEKLVLAAPRSVDFRGELAMAQGYRGAALAEAGRLDPAADVLARAIGHQDRAVQLGRNRQDTRAALVGLLFDRAGVNLKRGADQEAADDALRAPRVAAESGRGEAYFNAARILARLVGRVGGEPGLVPADRERRIRPYIGHAIVLVREALDSDPKLAGRIKEDPDLKALGSRPEFKTTLSALIDPSR